MKFIVILNRYGIPVFLVDENEDAVIFKRYEYAKQAAENNSLGQAAGYDIIEWSYEKE